MKHLGDITKINGTEIEPVDVIVGGSPCQDLSVAGKRAGLDGGRSGLFMEQIRVIKEMRDATTSRTDGHIRPRYMVWENVPGAFSSNKAEDFRIVLEETARVADSNAVIPRPPKNKWATAGCIMGDGWSIAWRVQDAQFWGVPQRRRRIALVADFGGHTAPEILFERKGVSGDIAESGAEREGTAENAEGGIREAEPVVFDGANVISKYNVQNPQPGDPCFTLSTDSRNYVIQGSMIGRADKNGPQGDGINEDVSFTLNTTDRHAVVGFSYKASAGAGTIGCADNLAPSLLGARHDAAVVLDMTHANDVFRDCGETVPTLQSRMGMGGNQVPLVMAHGQANAEIAEGVCPTLNCNHEQPIACFQNTGQGWWNQSDVGATVRTACGGDSTKVNLIAAVDCRNGVENPDINGTLQAKPNGGTSYNLQNTVRTHQSVRRLTPLECERLQGFPDNWTNIPTQTEVTAEDLSFWRTVWDEWKAMNGKKPKTDKQIIKWLRSEPADSARYKALGNSIALPPWRFVLSRIHAFGARTLGSLFDGIGGFPLIWLELPETATLWASEIEPFPIAVTKMRFNGAAIGNDTVSIRRHERFDRVFNEVTGKEENYA